MTKTCVMDFPECYKILNVAQGVNWAAIKKSYHSLAKQYHPDRNGGDPGCEARFKEINLAFQRLQSAHRNSRLESVDNRFENKVDSQPDSPAPQFGSSFLDRVEMNPIMRQALARLREIAVECERRFFLLNVYHEVTLDTKTALKGGTVKVKKGRRTFNVTIPPGSWNRMTLRLPGEGENSPLRDRRGDFVLTLRVLPTAEPVTGERELYYELKIPPEKIASGKVMTLDTTEGPIKFILPRNTADGMMFTLRARPDADPAFPTRHVVKVHLV
ncbi:MAG: hypothetical protein COV67_06355 [Nitrospinae bacterium CG11_big_fil_rev_8_21_14_0_20_56_8]|nr:MAG: hypothetical protein COV67_06355 [Nitrospinae bacterium CG11_big_fil_rev_8_21_14_0_20_56_8]